MSSLTNKYFHQSRESEQKLFNSMTQESIQLRGETYYYLPRDVQIENLVLGEDIVSKFGLAIPIEMYLEDVLGFQGDKEMFSKFGLEVKNTYSLVVHKDRWEQEVKSKFDGNQNNNEASFVIDNYIRPREGDLIYDPVTKYLLEIKFVDHDVEFYSLGKNYSYHMSCEAFQYQNEIIDTGVADIDIFDALSTDILKHQLLLEDGGAILLETGSYLLAEYGVLPEPTKTPYKTDFKPDATKINLTIDNPFS